MQCKNCIKKTKTKNLLSLIKTRSFLLIKLTSFCTAKETINKMRRQPKGWEKIFANNETARGVSAPPRHPRPQQKSNETDGGLTSSRKKSNQKIGKDLNKHFFKEDTQMKRNMKRCSKLPIIRKKEIKIVIRCHLIQARRAIIKKFTNKKCWVWRKGNSLKLFLGM